MRRLLSGLAAALILAGMAVVTPAVANGDDSQYVRNLAVVTDPDVPDTHSLWVTWDPPVSAGVTHYRLDIATTGAGSLPDYPRVVTASALMADPDVPTSPLTVVFLDLQPSSPYTVTVSAQADDVVWPASTVSGLTAAVAAATRPETPKNLVLTPQQNSITATWQAPDSDGGSPLTGYQIEVWPPTVGVIELGAVTSSAITGLQEDTRYTVNVVALNAVGQSSATTSAVRTLTPVGLARLGGATATTSASTTTLSASVLNSGRPTSVSRVGFLVSRTDPPLLDADAVTFVPASGGLSDTLTAATSAIADDQLYFVRAVLEATYPSGNSVSYGPSVPYATSTATIRFTNLNQAGRLGPNQDLANGAYSAGAGGGSLDHRVTILPNEPGIQRYAVEIPGAYRVEAAGAAGGGNGGRGALVRGTLVFVQDDPLMIAVGQRPSADETVEGGGGGTFVTRGTTLANAQPLIIAGGGGGGAGLPTQVRDQRAHGRAPAPGEVEAVGQDGGHIRCNRGGIACRSAAGRRGGQGGPVQELTSTHPTAGLQTASGGGGFLTSGSDSYRDSRDWYQFKTFQGSGGRSFRAGAAGGVQPERTNWLCLSGCSSLVGGFGGGGSPYRKWPVSHSPHDDVRFFGGGGGGYNGGGGGVMQPIGDPDGQGRLHNYPEATGGGGGSYNVGLAPEGITGGNADRAAGYVEMRLLAYQPEAGVTEIVGGRAGTTATLTSQVVSTGGDVAVQRGFVISQEPDPVLGGPGVQQLRASGVGTGSFSVVTPPMAARTFLYVRSYVEGYGGVGYGPVRTLSTLRPVTFTTAGVTGPQGPTQAQLDTAYAGTPLAGLVNTNLSASVPQGMQLVTISATGRYRIQALGARGGIALPRGFTSPPGGDRGGRGALVEGVFDLEEGDQLLIVVGQQPGNQVGGGGATFVVKGRGLDDADLTPLLVAGGGGAVSMPFDTLGIMADATAPSGSVTASAASFVDLSGVDGGGGLGFGAQEEGGRGWAGAGGGFIGDGAPGATGGAVGGAQVGAGGGRAFMNGGEGGEGTTCTGQNGSWAAGLTFTTAGGFGGGGAGAHYYRPNCWSQGGNGGGYNGAGALAPMAMDQYPRIGRGGGSLNTGIFPVGVPGLNQGSGLVHLSYIPPTQPGSLFAPVGAPQAVQVPAGTTLARTPGSVLTWRNGVLVEVATIAPSNTTTSARTFIDSTVGSDAGGLLVDVVEGSSGAEVVGLLSRRGTDEPLPVPVGALTGVSTSAGGDDVRMLLAGTDDQDEVRPRGSDGEPVAGAGGRITSIVTGLPPGTEGEVSLRSTPRLLGRFAVDAHGVATFVADVPGDLPAGRHTLVLATFSDGQQQEAVVSVGMTVVERTGVPGGSLPGGLGDLVSAPVSGATPGSIPPTTTPATPTTTSPPRPTVPPNTVPVQVAPPVPAGASPEVLRQRGDELVNTIDAVLPQGVVSPVAVQQAPSGPVMSGLLTNPATGQPLAVPVQNILLVQGDGTALILATAGADGSSTALTAEGAFQLPPGGRMGAVMAGFPAASDGQIVLFSQPTLLGTFTTDTNGVFAGDFALPTGLAPGRHTLVFTVGGVSQSLDVLVAGGEAPSGSLPATGRSATPVPWAVVMMTFGVAMILVTRRRSDAQCHLIQKRHGGCS